MILVKCRIAQHERLFSLSYRIPLLRKAGYLSGYKMPEMILIILRIPQIQH